MAEPFSLRWKLDQPHIYQNRSEDVHVLITIEPGAGGMAASVPQGSLPTHLILLVDVSGSMNYLIRRDPTARVVGKAIAEGRVSRRVQSKVPSRRKVACAVVARMAERLGKDDLLSLVAFDDNPHMLARALPVTARDELQEAVRKLAKVGGGGTALGKALQVVRQELIAEPDPVRTRRIVVLTDGEDQEPGLALAEAQYAGRDFRVPIVAFGMGECKVSFLSEVAKTTLTGSFAHIRNEQDAEQLFHQVLASQQNVQATNVRLKLWLSPEMYVRHLYRTRPEILYVGEVQPDAGNVVDLRLEQMERGKAYEFLFRCTVPARFSGQRFRIAKATLTYDLPSVNLLNQAVEANVVVEYTADEERARERSGDVRRVLARAEVQRQVLFLQNRIDALRRGQASDRDRTVVARLLKALVQKFEEFGEQATANHYRQMQEQFQREGTISQEMLNRSLAASSRADMVVAAQDIDF